MNPYKKQNKNKSEQTGYPEKYPQGFFKDKHCRSCSSLFSPKAPSELYCSDVCKDFEYTSRYLERNYGITLGEYNRMLKYQECKCAICGGEGFTMKECHKIKLVVDHCHTTGVVRGLLCHNCNRALGLFKDSPDSLIEAAKYLSKEVDFKQD